MQRHSLPPALADRAFTSAEAIRLGLSPGRLRGLDLTRPFHGVRHVSGLEFDTAYTYAARMDDHEFFSHATAARIHGLRLPPRLQETTRIDVGVFAPGRTPRAAGVRGHVLRRRTATLVARDGLRVVSAVDAWRQLAGILSVNELIVLGDGLVSRVAPLATLDELHVAVEKSAGMHGVDRLRLALPEIRPRTDSAPETRFRLRLIRAGLPEPVVNFAIVDGCGHFLGFADLAYPRWRVAAEYDGDHHREESQYFVDVDRLDAFMAENWRVIRVNRRHHPRGGTDPAVDRVRSALITAGWRPTP